MNPLKSEQVNTFVRERKKHIMDKHFFNFSIIFWKKIHDQGKIFMRMSSNVLNFARGYFNR